ncbi:unnamed protein product [Gemmata massiliana]|uniref:Uncharacterized protein n=1 Tax=Gemmata massiliana TaxID=1210884 RepID=A0A6P2D000_9BACT|nr:hypothetical protein [Gemmata massiliana]VTR93384.1 unnamed protein product [Gemmata massiliana]
MQNPFTYAHGQNGTEEEFHIISPEGRTMAVIEFWDEPGTDDAARARADVELIVNALNAYKQAGPNTLFETVIRRAKALGEKIANGIAA